MRYTPENITKLVVQHFTQMTYPQPLAGKKVVVSAGPTRELVDPVRYLTNFSTGKMGYAMAEAARDLGAQVVLVSGPTSLPKPSGMRVVDVVSAQNMFDAIMAEYDTADIVIKTAAVADYRPKNMHGQKMKKQPGDAVLELERTTDILATLGEQKTHQLLIGFAAETNDVVNYGTQKLTRKNADYIIANDVTEEGSGFGTDTNSVVLISKTGTEPFKQLPKKELALKLLQTIAQKEGL